jgi:hypothetical protein
MPQEHRKIYKVFIASPSDVEEERKVAFEVINKLNEIYENQNRGYRLEIRAWEKHSHPDIGLPQEVINRQISIDKCDIFIGIFWRRFGTPPGSVRPSDGKPYLSGTQQEIEEAIAAREASENERPIIMLYRKLDPPTGDLKDKEILQNAEVINFFQQCQPDGKHPALIGEFEGDDFRSLLKKHLLRTISEFEDLQGHTTSDLVDLDTVKYRRELWKLDSVEFETFCLDNFPTVYDRFSRGLRRDEMVNMLLDHCRRTPEAAERLDSLLFPYSNEGNWFDKIGLQGNPFRHQIAEEDEDLTMYRVQPQILKPIEAQIRGDDSKGRFIIYAKKGHGKTALRQMIEQRHFPRNAKGSVFCITCDVGALERISGYANSSLAALNSDHYVRLMEELVLESVENIPEYDSDFREFLSSFSAQGTSSNITAYQKLKALVERVQQWSFRGILCLVDQVDEVLIVNSQPENMLSLIRPLMSLSLQATPGVAFRYFLPRSLQTLLQNQNDIFRPGRYEIYHLKWNHRDLQKLIAQRLSAFSKHQLNPYSSLGELCDPEHDFRASVDQEVIQLAEGCPRAVIWLANRLIQLHLQAEATPRFIQRLTWEQVQAEWWAQGRHQFFGSMDQHEGFMLIGERIYCQGKPIFLSEKSETLLRCLIRARGNLCSKQDLILAGWPEDEPEGVTDGALQEAMRRMKNELEEDGYDSGWIATVRGRGYRLRKPTDTK